MFSSTDLSPFDSDSDSLTDSGDEDGELPASPAPERQEGASQLPVITEPNICHPVLKSDVHLVKYRESALKRRKPRSPDFRSPLDRSRSRSPHTHSKRVKFHRRDHSSQRGEERSRGHRHSRRVREDTPRYPHVHHHLKRPSHRTKYQQTNVDKARPIASVAPRQQNSKRQDIERSLSKMRIPASMRRSRAGSLHSPNIVPRNTQFYVEKPTVWNMAPEAISNSLLISLLEKTPLMTEVSTKMVRLQKVKDNFDAVRMFMRTSNNTHAWRCMRRETMAGAGLIGLTAFLEETISWQKLHLEHGLPLVGENDIICSSSLFLCHQILYKARDICGCHCQRPEVRSLIRQLTYLVVFSGRPLQAAELLQEIYIEDRLLYICAMSIIAALAPQIPSSSPLYYMIMDYICNFQYGTMMSLLSVVINEHSLRCNSMECTIISRSILGSHGATRGLFFIPSLK